MKSPKTIKYKGAQYRLVARRKKKPESPEKFAAEIKRLQSVMKTMSTLHEEFNTTLEGGEDLEPALEKIDSAAEDIGGQVWAVYRALGLAD